MSTDTDLVTGIIKFGNQANGRDKLFRLVQYGCKIVWWNLQQKEWNVDTIPKLKQLEASMSMTRKLLRLGKSLDFVQGALRSFHHRDQVIRLTLTMSKLNQACFLLFDHIIYAHNVGLVKADKQKWLQISARFWLFSLILNLVRNLYDIVNIVQHELKVRGEKNLSQNGDANHEEKTTAHTGNLQLVGKCVSENIPVLLDLAKNLSDIFLPLNSLKKIQVSAGTQGILGVISSIVGMVTLWNPRLKLVPS